MANMDTLKSIFNVNTDITYEQMVSKLNPILTSYSNYSNGKTDTMRPSFQKAGITNETSQNELLSMLPNIMTQKQGGKRRSRSNRRKRVTRNQKRGRRRVSIRRYRKSKRVGGG